MQLDPPIGRGVFGQPGFADRIQQQADAFFDAVARRDFPTAEGLLRVLLTAVSFLLAPIVLIIGFLAVKQQFIREPCRPYVDTEFAIATIESELRRLATPRFLMAQSQ